MIAEAGSMDVRAGAPDAPRRELESALPREPGIFHSTHLLRELVAADARSEAAGDPLADRAEALLLAVLSGLELVEGAIIQVEPAGTGAVCLAARGIPDHARELLEARLPHLASLRGSLVQRALGEHRVLLLDRATRDPLMPALREANPDIDHAAVVPLVDQGVPVGGLVLVARGGRLNTPLLRSLAIAFRVLGLLLAPGRGRAVTAPRAEDPGQGVVDSERLLFEIEELTQRLDEARETARQLEERASSGDAALRADLESARARNAELEAQLAGVSPIADRTHALEEQCAAQSRTIEEQEQRVTDLEDEVRILLERIEQSEAEAHGAVGNGATRWADDAAGEDEPALGEDEPESEATIELSDAGDEQLGDIAAAAAAALDESNGIDAEAEAEAVAVAESSESLAPEEALEAVVAALDAPPVALEPGPAVAVLHVDSHGEARGLARDSAEAAGAAYWCGGDDMPYAANAIAAVNLLDDELVRAVGADARLWSASRWIVYGADAASGMGFELGSCALLRRPIETRCCLEQIQRKAGRKINGILLVSAQLREVAGLRQALQEVDAAGSVACDTKQALDLLEILRRPDAIMIDLALPHGQGLALAAQLRRQPETSSLPLLLLLPPVVDPARLRAEAEKAQLLGPFVAEDVHRLVRATLAGRA